MSALFNVDADALLITVVVETCDASSWNKKTLGETYAI